MASVGNDPLQPELDTGQIAALRNLEAKRTGKDVDYICIADARTLTDLGLAERTAQGWIITPTGSARIAAHDD